MQTKVKGYIAGAVAAATYGTNPLFALPLYQEGMTASSVLFYRYVIGLPLVAVMLFARGHSLAVAPRMVPPLMVMGVLMASSSWLLFESYNYMDAAIASTLLFVYPLMVALLMAVFFRQRVSLLTGVCIAGALAGIALLFRRPDDATLSPVGTAMVMLSSLAYAIYIIGVDSRRLRGIPTLKVIFYVLSAGVLVFGGLIAFDPAESFAGPEKWYMWGCLLALAVLPTVVSFVCTTVASHYIGPTPTAILGALEPVTAVAIGVLAFGERLVATDYLGLVLIVGAVSLVVAGDSLGWVMVHFRKLFPRRMRGMARRRK